MPRQRSADSPSRTAATVVVVFVVVVVYILHKRCKGD
jgi:hypothetical protein